MHMFAFLKKHKNLIFLCVLLLTLAGSYLWNQYQLEELKTVSLPISRTGGDSPTPTPSVVRTPLAEYQVKREATRQADMAALETLASNEKVDQAARDQAQEELQEVIRCRECELAIEGALTGAGLAPCVAVVQRGAVTVLVEKKELSQTEATMILTLATAHTGEVPENIRIITGNMI
jgi:hypothetical protein